MDDGTFLQTHQNLGLTIHIPVVANDVLLIILEVSHVRSAVDPPQHGAIEFQHLEDSIFTIITVLGEAIDNFLLVIVFQQYFNLSVAINISTAGIVRYEGRGD